MIPIMNQESRITNPFYGRTVTVTSFAVSRPPSLARTRTTKVPGAPNVTVDESKVKHAYVRGKDYQFDHVQGMAVGADGSLYIMDIYPQLNVVCFPKLTAPR